ncbi:hypothetical protein [Niveibacterium sp.]|uniref:hypothetical protein n=1 Tax=Niveibacterium sp. TaxID=2017444 RepID=UPI0035B1B27C
MTVPKRRRLLPALFLLWVLLLLPLMQLGAFAHGYGHAAQATEASRTVQAPLAPDATQCEACLAFSGVTGGIAGAASIAALQAPDAVFELPCFAPTPRAVARLPYASRAPPYVLA